MYNIRTTNKNVNLHCYIDRYRVVKMITRWIFLKSTNLVLKGSSVTSPDGKHWNGLSISNSIQTCTKRGHTTVGWIYITSWIFLLCLTFLYLNIYPRVATWKMYRFYRQSTEKRPRQWRRACTYTSSTPSVCFIHFLVSKVIRTYWSHPAFPNIS